MKDFEKSTFPGTVLMGAGLETKLARVVSDGVYSRLPLIVALTPPPQWRTSSATEAFMTGSKNPTWSCPSDRWKWSTLYAIAELLEFPDHASCACAFGLGTDCRTPFLVA